MSTKFVGAEWQEQAWKQTLNANGGWTIVRSWKCIPSKVEELCALIRTYTTFTTKTGIEVDEITPDIQIDQSEVGAYTLITATYNGVEDPVYTIVGNDLEKSIFQLPHIVNIWNKIVPMKDMLQSNDVTVLQQKIDDLAFLKNIIKGLGENSIKMWENVTRYKTDTNASESKTNQDWMTSIISDYGITGEEHDLLMRLAASISAGTESFTLSQYVLKKTQFLSRLYLRSQTQIDTDGDGIDDSTQTTFFRPWFENIGKLFTRKGMADNEWMPVALEQSLPEKGVWLKRTPTLTQENAQRWRIEQEYWWSQYADKLVYPDEPIDSEVSGEVEGVTGYNV